MHPNRFGRGSADYKSSVRGYQTWTWQSAKREVSGEKRRAAQRARLAQVESFDIRIRLWLHKSRRGTSHAANSYVWRVNVRISQCHSFHPCMQIGRRLRET